ncbi:MAG: YdeI/OmpD-associated family protein [Phycisphaerales bacterium]|nr:YdeI/OmpD-associated family protein [Phycisphaerales bacterium]
MPKPRAFVATIQSAGGGGAYVDIPFDVGKAFGSKRPKVCATFDGEPYRGTAVRMGADCHMLIILKSIREKIGKRPGDRVKVTMALDGTPRIITPPKDFSAEMKAVPEAAAFWKALAYTHKREYVKWIEEARREETRQRRIAKAVAMLARSEHRS